MNLYSKEKFKWIRSIYFFNLQFIRWVLLLTTHFIFSSHYFFLLLLKRLTSLEYCFSLILIFFIFKSLFLAETIWFTWNNNMGECAMFCKDVSKILYNFRQINYSCERIIKNYRIDYIIIITENMANNNSQIIFVMKKII